jgi:hypothetical protein
MLRYYRIPSLVREILCKIQTKKPSTFVEGFRGVERIRTAVDGVADHCLATRPRHLI